jgi:L-ribulokinase
MFGAVAAGKANGGYDSIFEASQAMAHLREDCYTPIPRTRPSTSGCIKEYQTLHDYFGRGENDVMKRLKALKVEVLESK